MEKIRIIAIHFSIVLVVLSLIIISTDPSETVSITASICGCVGMIVLLVIFIAVDDMKKTSQNNNKNAMSFEREANDYYPQSSSVRYDDTPNGMQTKAHLIIGEKIKFGRYPHDDDSLISWLVLARDGDKALLISNYALDIGPFIYRAEGSWRTCTIRKWLNNYFYNEAFSLEEKKHIVQTSVRIDSENSTTDKVFLLSVAEVKQYFSDNSARICYPTSYTAMKCGYSRPWFRDELPSCEACSWWLRSSEFNGSLAPIVYTDGSVSTDDGRSSLLFNSYDGVRPVIWVRIF